MRKLFVLCFAAALALSPICANAGFVDNGQAPQQWGSFSGPMSGAMAETVAKARDLQDDAPVVLTGNIVSQMAGHKERYVFKDETGEIPVKIGRKAFAGQTVTPSDTVRISGKVDKDFGKEVKIKVRRLEVIR